MQQKSSITTNEIQHHAWKQAP